VLVWQNGFANWKRAADVGELAPIVVRPPPIPNRTEAIEIMPSQKPQWFGSKVFLSLGGLGGAIVGTIFANVFGVIFWWPAALILETAVGFGRGS
jgi:hypothetical protein